MPCDNTPAPLERPAAKASRDAARRVVTCVSQHCFGERPRRLRPLSGGLSNQVFRLEVRAGALVVRLHEDANMLGVYRKEAWAMARAREVGVPTPRVLAVGHETGRPYMMLEEVPGIAGTHWSEPAHVLRQLGALAARLHQVRTQGFGQAIAGADQARGPWPRWADFLEHELRVDERLNTLDRTKALPRPARRALEDSVARMRRWSRLPALQHGDLRLKNVIVSPEDGHIRALLDWEDCLSAPPPYWDLAIALHDVGPDAKEAFLEGYGLSAPAFARLAPVLRALNVLNYAWAIELALAQGQHQRAAWLKARLRGVFDIGP